MPKPGTGVHGLHPRQFFACAACEHAMVEILKRHGPPCGGRRRALEHVLEHPAVVAIEPAGERRTAPAHWLARHERVVELSNRVELQWVESKPVTDALPGELAVSRPGTLAAAIVTPSAGAPFVVASMYAPWEKPHVTTGSTWIYADGSVHRLISDLSALVGQQTGHRIVAAGDLNILNGYGEHGSSYWASRYATVFARMEAIGFALRRPAGAKGPTC